MIHIERDVYLPNKVGLNLRPEFVRRMLHEHHKIRFVFHAGEWLVTYLDGGQLRLFFTAGPRLCEAETMRKINIGKVGRLNPYQAEKMLDELDRRQEVAESYGDAAAQEKISEGSDRLYSELTKRSRVAMTGRPHQ